MEMEADILNSFEDIHDSWDESTCDLLTQDSKPNQLVVQIEETGNSMPKDLGAKLYSECSDVKQIAYTFHNIFTYACIREYLKKTFFFLRRKTVRPYNRSYWQD